MQINTFIPPNVRVVAGDQLHRLHRQVMWHEWTPGVESAQDLVLQNVALVTQKVGWGPISCRI